MQEKILITNKRGLNLSTVIHKPNSEGKYPAVILLHGFTGYKDETHIVALAEKFEEAGFVAVRFDASGFAESEGNLENDYRVSNYLNDIQSVYDYLKQQNYVDINRIGIWGNSLGCILAIVFAFKHPKIKAVCLVSPPTTVARKDNFERKMKDWKQSGYYEKESSRYGHVKIPYDFVTDAQRYNSLDYIKEIKQPLMIILGRADTNVYPETSKEIYKKANQPKELIEIENMDHFYKKIPEQTNLVNSHVLNFFKKNL